MLPATNAKLTAIRPAEFSEDGDFDGQADDDRWTGQVGVWVAEEQVENADGDTVDELVQTRLEIPYDVGRQIVRGDVLVYDFEDSTHERRAATIVRAALVGRVKVLVSDR